MSRTTSHWAPTVIISTIAPQCTPTTATSSMGGSKWANAACTTAPAPAAPTANAASPPHTHPASTPGNMAGSKWATSDPTTDDIPAAPDMPRYKAPRRNPQFMPDCMNGSKWAIKALIMDDEPAAPDMPCYEAPRCNPHFTPECMNESKWATVRNKITAAPVPAAATAMEAECDRREDWASMMEGEEERERRGWRLLGV